MKMRVPGMHVIGVCSVVCGCSTNTTTVDADLTESIGWYTGTVGHVDNDRAKELLLRAAADGDEISTMWMARVYSRGRMGFEEHPDTARAIANRVIAGVEAAARAGTVEAIFLMGTAYAEGLGREQNDSVAVEWYRQAADLGHVLAQHNMGNVYFAGTGVPQNDSAAVYWWTLAANQGDAIPQLRLATMYEQGRGVEQDLAQARRWLEDSAGRGNAEAAEALDRFGR